MESIWKKEIEIPQRECISKDMKTDVTVIGAGMAGVLTAYFLQNEGMKVVVLDAKRIAEGQTQNTTAKITSQHGLFYHGLIEKYGKHNAKLYADANQEAISDYKNLIERNNIDCDFSNLPAYLYTIESSDTIKKEAEAAKMLGIDSEMTEATTLPFEVKSALKFNNQAQFHPLKFIKSISEQLNIYENSFVKKVEDGVVITEGGKVTSKYVIVATHYPFINVPGFYFTRMHQERSYVVAIEWNEALDGMYYGIDKNTYSFRGHDGFVLLTGGGHRTGENSSGGKYEELINAAQRFYPGSEIKAKWSAQDCVTIDSIPYIGRYSETTPNLYVATGFKKWGMTNSMVSAKTLTDLILERENRYARFFSPQRFKITASAKMLIEEGIQSIKGLSREFFGLPRTEIDKLPIGHGGVVDYKGEKLGVYKDESGEVYVISTRCTHLGCQLEWNPDQLSWDCPCHGSRFDYKGNLIDNPAMNSIKHEKLL